MNAALLGLVEGLTEFIPVSSTGHLLLLSHFLGISEASKTMEVVIQLGPILAIMVLYRAKLWHLITQFGRDPDATRFGVSVLLAFLPAMVAGFFLHDFIKAVLFESPRLISWSLIIGGVVLLLVDRMAPEPVVHEADKMPFGKALAIGVAQCLAMIPGVSRSGATIVSALLLGVNKRAAAEFSFFLSLPTMLGAVSLDLFKARHELDLSTLAPIAVALVVATVSGALVMRWLLDYVSTKGFAPFGWWRIIVGSSALVALSFGY